MFAAPGSAPAVSRPSDPADAVARVAHARRELVLRAHRGRLRREDLEDCYSQATLELIARARDGDGFAGVRHIEHALEQKVRSRIQDRLRAEGGRSPMQAALAAAASLEGEAALGQARDRSPGVEQRVSAAFELRHLREVAAELGEDQRLVLACQVTLGMECAEFCALYGWTPERFRKVAQRARRRLRELTDEYATGARCRRLAPDLLALRAGVATEDERRRARAHLENCIACRHAMRQMELAERRVAALIPLPAVLLGVRSGASAAGGASLASAGAVGAKAGALALCVAGLSGGVALCAGGRGAPSAPVAPARPAVTRVLPQRPRASLPAGTRAEAAPPVAAARSPWHATPLAPGGAPIGPAPGSPSAPRSPRRRRPSPGRAPSGPASSAPRSEPGSPPGGAQAEFSAAVVRGSSTVELPVRSVRGARRASEFVPLGPPRRIKEKR